MAVPLEDFLVLLHRERLPGIFIPDTTFIRNGSATGLFRYEAAQRVVMHDAHWPRVDYDGNQRSYAAKRAAAETSAKLDVIVNHLCRDAASPEAPAVMLLTLSQPTVAPGSDFDDAAAAEVCCEFMSRVCFGDALRARELPDCLALRYTTPASGRHNLVRVLFTPYVLKVEQHECLAAADDASIPMRARVATSHGHGGAGFRVVPPTPALTRAAGAMAQVLFDYFRRAHALALDQAVLYGIEIREGVLQLLWASKLELRDWHFAVDPAGDEPVVTADPFQAAGSGTPVAGRGRRASPSRGSSRPSSASPGRPASASSRAARPMSASLGRQGGGAAASAAPRVVLTPAQCANRARRDGAVQPPSSPLAPASSESVAQINALLADVRDFGFFSDEAERIRESLKRQIRSIVRVALPPTMDVDDTPPYDDAFIAALCDPRKAERYFNLHAAQPTGRAASRRSGSIAGAARDGAGGRARSLSLRGRRKSVATVTVDEAVQSINRHLTSFRRRPSASAADVPGVASPASPPGRSGHNSSISGVFAQSTSFAESPLPPQQDAQPGGTATSVEQSLAFALSPGLRHATDPAEAAKPASVRRANSVVMDEAFSGMLMDAGVLSAGKNGEVLAQLAAAEPDWKHSGHVARIRRKYGATSFEDEEEEAEFRRIVRLKRAAVQAKQDLDELRQRAASAARARPRSASVASGPAVGGGASAASSVAPDTRARQEAATSHARRQSNASSVARSAATSASRHHAALVIGRADTSADPALAARERQWVDVQRRTHDDAPPFRRLCAATPQSLTAPLVRPEAALPDYEARLASGSLLGYLVGTEQFERRREEPKLRVPPEDIQQAGAAGGATAAATLAALAAMRVPEAPVVELRNTHASLSEEMLQRRRREAARRGERLPRDMLTRLFGEQGASGDESDDGAAADWPNSASPSPRRGVSGGAAHNEVRRRQRSGFGSPDAPMASVTSPGRHSRSVLGRSGVATWELAERSAAEALRQQLASESKTRREQLARHGVAAVRDRVQLIAGTLEDLVYQWQSQRAESTQMGRARASGTQRGGAAAAAAALMRDSRMILYVPAAYYHLRQELRSLMLAIGFAERLVDAASVPSSVTHVPFECNDDATAMAATASHVKEFSIDASAVSVARVLACTRQFAADVAGLFREGAWEALSRVREMTENEGYTFVDAIMTVRPRLAERAGVSRLTEGFATVGRL